MKLWYQQPARVWSEALPIGNGRLGAMVFGGTGLDHIQLNEDSIWSGKQMDRINPDALAYLPVIRRLIREKKTGEAQRLALYALSGTPNSERSYQTAGDLMMRFYGLGAISDYTRELDLENGCVRVCFRAGGATHHREYLCSCPDNCIAVRMWTQERLPFSFDCQIGRKHNASDEIQAQGGNSVHFVCDCSPGGVAFTVNLRVDAKDGRVRTIGEHIVAEQVTEALLILDIETSFRQADHTEAAIRRCEAVVGKPWQEIASAHTEDHRALFSRQTLHFGRTDPQRALLPTDVRLKEVQSGAEDLGLMELYFQYGRYLLIACSRPGSLPANLQGIWNDSMTPPWDSKYTININTEMNYWLAESANLSECHLPLFDHLERIKHSGQETARRMYGCRGTVAHHNTDIYADTAPQDHYIPATFWVMGEAWLATHVWEHYLYTSDKAFLQAHFDVLEQCVLFFEDFLIENEAGYLVTSPSLSPENTYRRSDGSTGVLCEGATMDVEILVELFRAYIGACRVLELAEDRILRAQAMMDRFPPLQIGRHGQLMEWMEDYDEVEPGHRHISHLYGVYPGSSIHTPELRRAARTSLERRLEHGGGHTGWSRAWIIGLWAAFGDGAKAYENLHAILTMGTFPNLMDTHLMGGGHVFQIDGNLGAAAAMLEMLVQCRDGRLKLLPAITRETSSGSVTGVRIRGGAELSMVWQDGAVQWVQIVADRLQAATLPITLEMNGATRTLTLIAGETITVDEQKEA